MIILLKNLLLIKRNDVHSNSPLPAPAIHPALIYDDDVLLSLISKHKGKAPILCTRKKPIKKSRYYTPRINDDTDEELLIMTLLEDDITL